MSMLTVRNVPPEVHRALRARAALRGHSTEAEVRAIPQEAVKPGRRVHLGTLLAGIGRRAKLTARESSRFARRDTAPA